MQTITIPRSVAAAPVGSVILTPGSELLTIWVRERHINAGNYPNPCSVSLHLPSWNEPPVLAISLLLRFARKERLTFQTFLNAADAQSRHCLKNLAESTHLTVNVCTEQSVERSIRVPNIAKRFAIKLTQQLADTPPKWTTEQFAAARRVIDGLYPTPSQLWRACEKDMR